MAQSISNIALVVRDYDEAIAFYCNVLGFELLEDSYQSEQDKRWVVVRPKCGKSGLDGRSEQGYGTCLVLARASKREQAAFIGNQAGGRVFLFLASDDFERDYTLYRSRGVEFVRDVKKFDYGTVAVFKDLYGNLWDLVQFADGHPLAV